MTITRRHVLAGALAAPAIIAASAPQLGRDAHSRFPTSSPAAQDEGDFRDRLCRKFAAELEKRTTTR